MTRLSLQGLLTLTCSLGLVACGGKTTDNVDNPTPEAALTMLSLSIDLDAIVLGADVVAQVVGRYDDGTEKDLTSSVTWGTSDATVIEVVADAPGTFRTLAEGSAMITAAYEGLMGSKEVTVGPATLVRLELIPASGDFGFGGHLNLTVLSHKSDGSRDTVTEIVEWESSRETVAIASSQEKGRLVTFGQGTTTITATMDGVSVTGEYTVTEPRVEYLRVTPENIRVTFAEPVQFSAEAVYSDHDPSTNRHVEDVTAQVTWVSSDETVLVINESGLATAVGDGDVVITASVDGINASTIARTVSIACPYPDDFIDGIEYDNVVPPLFWLDAYTEAGATVDFRLEEAYCNAETNKTILFVIGAGWCPYCPDYMRAVNDVAQDLAEAGSIIVYVEIETSGGAPANNMQANSIVDREVTMPLGPSLRVGDGAVNGSNQPFSRAVSAIPSAFIMRTSDMRIIASQARASGRLDWVNIARNPDRLH